MQFTISARSKPPAVPIQRFIKECYSHIPLKQIDSFFGFTEACSLYGGRFFARPELSRYDVKSLYRMNINVRLPLSNHFATVEEYEESRQFLEKYHRPGNSLIITNDDLARWIFSVMREAYMYASLCRKPKSQISRFADITIRRQTYSQRAQSVAMELSKHRHS